jgi:hypothetical protein
MAFEKGVVFNIYIEANVVADGFGVIQSHTRRRIRKSGQVSWRI